MKEHNSALRAHTLEPVENLTGITSSEASRIAAFYRAKGGFKIQITEHQFRSNILVTPLATAYTTFQGVRS